MLHRLTILLLIVGVFAQETEMSELEKQMLYKQNDVSPLLVALCAITPTMGHMAVGKWKRGFKTLPLVITGGVLLGIGSSGGCQIEFLGIRGCNWMSMSSLPFVSSYILQFQDAIYLAYQHNADLYEEIYKKEYIRPPKKSIIQKWIDKKEDK